MPLRPTHALLGLLLLWTALGLAASIWPALSFWWRWSGVLMSLLALCDALSVVFLKPLSVERTLPSRMAVGIESDLRLRLVNGSKRHLHLSVYDGIPARSDCDIFPWKGWVRKQAYLDLNYPITLHDRGEVCFGKTHILLSSLLGLWSRRHLLGENAQLRVYPNYQPVLSYALMAMAHRPEHSGIVRKNRAGLSRDFHQLRDYQMGDSLTQIDWKASSKRQALISRDFQEQLDQSVILMLDCGRRMRTMDGKIRQFDHCLNSMLLLSYIALRQGDQIGVLSFGGTERWLPPVKGSSAMTTILNHLYDYETSPFPSDFSEAAERLLKVQRRRSMVILMTNLRGEDAEELREPLRKLREKHLVVLASLQESGIGEMREKELRNFDDALAYLAAEDYAAERERVLAGLEGDGIVTLDETAQRFPVALANAYLDRRQSI